MSREELKLAIILLLKNIVAIICFTVLAILFERWWIVFFSALFLSSIEYSKDKNKN